jgi:hypothetical protein
MPKVVSKNVSTFGNLSSNTLGFQPIPMPNLQDLEGKLFQNFKKKGQIVSVLVSTKIAIYCNNLLIA